MYKPPGSPTASARCLADTLAHARRFLAQGAWAQAQFHAEAALAIDPAILAARLIANQAAFIAGDYPAAMAHVDAGLRHEPASADLHLRRARYLIVLNDRHGARQALAISRQHAQASTAPWGMIADALTLIGDFADAVDAYGHAIALQPTVAQNYFNRAVVARYLGDRDQATRDYEAAIAIFPGYAEALLNLVHLTRQTPAVNRIAMIEDVLRRLPEIPVTLRQRICLHYALAKSLEDMGDGLRSFAHLETGTRLQRGTFQYESQRDIAVIGAIKIRYPSKPKQAAQGFGGIKPIFVLGLPRSGSTLVERILSSHSQIGSIGETPAFERALGDIGGDDPTAIGKRYADLTAPWRGDQEFFVDKLPNNHLHVGAILAALPNARVVHIIRDPVANLYGMYKTLFNQAYPYSYDLDELVSYYAAYRSLMAHWRGVCDERLIEVAYEDLVDQPKAVTHRLLAACGLDWQPDCLNFHKNARPCTTQSASQIRAPLNRDGIEGIRRFEEQLEPLCQKLAAALFTGMPATSIIQ